GHAAVPRGHAAVPRGHDATPGGHDATPGGHEASPGARDATPGAREALLFSDPEGQQLGLVADRFVGDSTPWDGGVVPAEHAIRGLLGAEIHSLSASNSVLFLEDYLGFPAAAGVAGDGDRRLLRVETEVSVAELHIVTADTSPGGQGERVGRAGRGARAGSIPGGAGAGRAGRVGIGGVHHIAFRVETAAEQEEWLSYLNERGVPNSGLVDRHYFQSLYFREPGGILFEIATAGPGFLGDEDVEHLGETLSLPPFLESKRQQIEAGLEPVPSY
ncbi:MAG: VOC family protein, partial [Spirochaetia bacterium]